MPILSALDSKVPGIYFQKVEWISIQDGEIDGFPICSRRMIGSCRASEIDVENSYENELDLLGRVDGNIPSELYE